MHAFYYTWSENSSIDIEQTFQSLHITYKKVSTGFSNYLSDQKCIDTLQAILSADSFDFIFSFNYFPFLSILAEKNQIPYISWVYDCPHLTLFCRTVTSPYNYFFLFDRHMCEELITLGASHVKHMPLAVNISRLNYQLGAFCGNTNYHYDLSFVGNLYDNSMYDQVSYLPDYLTGYIDAIIHSQQQIWGYNFANELLTDTIVHELETYIHLSPDTDYSFTSKYVFADMLNTKITSLDRISLLTKLGEHFNVNLFTNSPASLCPTVKTFGPISYTDEMPFIFRSSKINLNISLRSITSGIPLRCLDILGAGGFLLSNYQPELAEYFIPNVDFVYFESKADLLEKVSYYLQNEKERIQIALHGYQKATALFSYEHQFKCILDIVFK